MDDFNEKFVNLVDSHHDYIKNNGISNVYLSYGLIEFDSYLAPGIFIPIFI